MKWNTIGFAELPSPCYVINCDELKKSLEILKKNCGLLKIKPLLAIKGFPLAHLFQDMAPYFYGTSASSLYEAKLGSYMKKENHIHMPAYRPDEFAEVMALSDHIVFNSFSQWETYKPKYLLTGRQPSIGLRINPEYTEVKIEKYNTCSRYSRFGITQSGFCGHDISGVDGLHLHVMYDHSAETFAKVIKQVIAKFENILYQVKWINFGGGQRLADDNYRIELIEPLIKRLINEFGIEVYIEPCEAIVSSSGYLVSTVLDIIENEKMTAILDTSALCHMPDVIQEPYTPELVFPPMCREGKFKYILSGISCLAGDIIGEYAFDLPLHIGQKIVFCDMGAYTFAKENYFNGINFPSIVLYCQKSGFEIVKHFSYKDYEHCYL